MEQTERASSHSTLMRSRSSRDPVDAEPLVVALAQLQEVLARQRAAVEQSLRRRRELRSQLLSLDAEAAAAAAASKSSRHSLSDPPPRRPTLPDERTATAKPASRDAAADESTRNAATMMALLSKNLELQQSLLQFQQQILHQQTGPELSSLHALPADPPVRQQQQHQQQRQQQASALPTFPASSLTSSSSLAPGAQLSGAVSERSLSPPAPTTQDASPAPPRTTTAATAGTAELSAAVELSDIDAVIRDLSEEPAVRRDPSKRLSPTLSAADTAAKLRSQGLSASKDATATTTTTTTTTAATTTGEASIALHQRPATAQSRWTRLANSVRFTSILWTLLESKAAAAREAGRELEKLRSIFFSALEKVVRKWVKIPLASVFEAGLDLDILAGHVRKSDEPMDVRLMKVKVRVRALLRGIIENLPSMDKNLLSFVRDMSKDGDLLRMWHLFFSKILVDKLLLQEISRLPSSSQTSSPSSSSSMHADAAAAAASASSTRAAATVGSTADTAPKRVVRNISIVAEAILLACPPSISPALKASAVHSAGMLLPASHCDRLRDQLGEWLTEQGLVLQTALQLFAKTVLLSESLSVRASELMNVHEADMKQHREIALRMKDLFVASVDDGSSRDSPASAAPSSQS